MYHFEYITKREASPEKNNIIEMIKEVQNLVRDKFTFEFIFIGSTKNNMITQDVKSNIGYDFDIDLAVNIKNNLTPKEIKCRIMNAFNKVVKKYGYDFCEDETRVFTIKSKDTENSKIKHSCDFGIIDNKNHIMYIHHNKKDNEYSWATTEQKFAYLQEKCKWLKKKKLWNDLRNNYLDKKNKNNDSNKHSRSIFAESVNEMCQKNGYKN